MQEAYSKGALAIANILIGKILTSFISSFRKREIYLTYDHILESTNKSKLQFTTLLKVINKGKDKEKNIEIIFPKNKSVTIISTDHLGVQSSANKITIDRILSNESLLINVMIHQGELLGNNYKPAIRSEDANGKAYRGLNNIPMGYGPAIITLIFFVVMLTVISLSFILKVNPITYTEEKYFNYKYKNLFNAGYDITPYYADDLLKYYNVNESKLPLQITKINLEDGNILAFTFRFRNNMPHDVYLSSDFETDNEKEFNKETSKITYSEIKGQAYIDEMSRIAEKYHAVPFGFKTSQTTKVSKNTEISFKVTRPYFKDLNPSDLNIKFSIINTENNYFSQIRFIYSKSLVKSKLIDGNNEIPQ